MSTIEIFLRISYKFLLHQFLEYGTIFVYMITAQFIKKASLIFFSFSALALLLFNTVLPSTALGVGPVSIRGNLKNVVPGPQLKPIANQQVTVTCGSVTKNATTNSSGLYTVEFTEPGCNPFSQVSTKSTYNASVQTKQVWVSSEGRATIDLYF